MPKIFVEVTRSFTDCAHRPEDAPHPTVLAWQDAVIAAMEILLDLRGVSAAGEALNPFFIELPEDEVDHESRRPLELWALLSKIEHWTDRFQNGEEIMQNGRQWIGLVPFEDQKVDVLIFAAQPDFDVHVIGLLQALPQGAGPDAIEAYLSRVEADEVFDEIAGAHR